MSLFNDKVGVILLICLEKFKIKITLIRKEGFLNV
jgi:hypothetical protein